MQMLLAQLWYAGLTISASQLPLNTAGAAVAALAVACTTAGRYHVAARHKPFPMPACARNALQLPCINCITCITCSLLLFCAVLMLVLLHCRDGCKVSLGFFNDVVIPDYSLQNPSFYHDTERVWYWQYGDDKLPMDPGQEIRFRVASIRFNPMPTAAQQAAVAAAAAAAAPGGAAAAAAGAAPAAPIVYSPMEILGDIDGDGLGLTEWWLPAQEEEAEGAADANGHDVEMEAA